MGQSILSLIMMKTFKNANYGLWDPNSNKEYLFAGASETFNTVLAIYITKKEMIN